MAPDGSSGESAEAEADERFMRAVERLGQTLEGTGVPRMSARVFAYVLAEGRDTYTARDLAEGLQVSPAAISGAVKFLVDTRLLLRERAPGRRGDLFRIIDDDVWSTILEARIPLLGHYVRGAEEAIAIMGGDGPGVRRLEETRDFFLFVQEDIAGTTDRWRRHRADLDR